MKLIKIFLLIFLTPMFAICQKTVDSDFSADGSKTYSWHSEYDNVYDIGYNSWKVVLDGQVGYFEHEVGLVLPPIYQDILKLDETTVGVKADNMWAIFSDGEFVTDFIFNLVLAKEGDYYVVKKSGSYGFYGEGRFVQDDYYMGSGYDDPAVLCDPATENCELSEREATLVMFNYIKYPAEAREMGLQGDVMVALYISEFGDVDYVYVVQSAGIILDNATIDLYTQTLNRFRPAFKDGVPVASVFLSPIRYRLE